MLEGLNISGEIITKSKSISPNVVTTLSFTTKHPSVIEILNWEF